MLQVFDLKLSCGLLPLLALAGDERKPAVFLFKIRMAIQDLPMIAAGREEAGQCFSIRHSMSDLCSCQKAYFISCLFVISLLLLLPGLNSWHPTQ